MSHDYREDEMFRLRVIEDLLRDYCRLAHGELLDDELPGPDLVDFMRDFRAWLDREDEDLGLIMKHSNTLTRSHPQRRPSDVMRGVDTSSARSARLAKHDRLHHELVDKVLDTKASRDVKGAIARDAEQGESKSARRRRRKRERLAAQQDPLLASALARRQRLAS